MAAQAGEIKRHAEAEYVAIGYVKYIKTARRGWTPDFVLRINGWTLPPDRAAGWDDVHDEAASRWLALDRDL